MSYFFTSESVSEGHPDKVADQISDAILDAFLAQDPESKVACETLVTTGLAVLSGEINSKAKVNIEKEARDVIKKIGYTNPAYKFEADSCKIMSVVHEQSPDILQGVIEGKGLHAEQGAGDQGIMFGYATNETENFMPLALSLSHMLLQELAVIRREDHKVMHYLRPDAKSQVTIQYSDQHLPERIDTIVISTQHDDFDEESKMLAKIKNDIVNILVERVKQKLPEHIVALFDDTITYHVNPTGKFVIGGPHGDTGLTGRKIIVDTYGGKGAHGGGAFSGKDPSKVDRSAAYATRHIAKNLVASGVSDQILVQVAYAIGVADPMNIFIDTYGTSKVAFSDSEIARKVSQLFDMRPAAIVNRFKLKDPIYSETAAYGQRGRDSELKTVTFKVNKEEYIHKEIETFPWEKLDFVEKIKPQFGL
jgi:S-adenosylmethionine synthetase